MPRDVGLHLPFQVLDRHQRGEGAVVEQLPDGTPEETVQILRPGQGRVPLRKQVLLQARRCEGKWGAPATIIFLQKHILRQNATQLSMLCRMPNSVGEGFVPDVMS